MSSSVTKRVGATGSPPRDHQTKKLKVKALPDGTQQVTIDGLKLVIDDSVFLDFEMMEWSARLQEDEKGNAQLMPLMFRRMLGQEQFAAVKDKLRDPATGKVSLDDGFKFLGQVFQAINPNSSPSAQQSSGTDQH